MSRRLPLLLAGVLILYGTAKAETFRGVVSDSKCGNNHSSASQADTDCVRKCVAGGAKYVLEWGGHVMELNHQERFAKYPGWLVDVEGTRQGNSIDVKSVEPMLHYDAHGKPEHP